MLDCLPLQVVFPSARGAERSISQRMCIVYCALCRRCGAICRSRKKKCHTCSRRVFDRTARVTARWHDLLMFYWLVLPTLMAATDTAVGESDGSADSLHATIETKRQSIAMHCNIIVLVSLPSRQKTSADRCVSCFNHHQHRTFMSESNLKLSYYLTNLPLCC